MVRKIADSAVARAAFKAPVGDTPWHNAVSELARIWMDPLESRKRRNVAEAALTNAGLLGSSGGDSLIHSSNGTPHPRGYSGGDYLHAEAIYDGWGDLR